MLSGRLEPLTAGTAATSWRLDPVGLAVILVLGGGYLLAVRRLRAGGAGWPLRRAVTFLLGGLGSLALTTCSFLGVYAPVLRWVAVIQACVLLLVCPVLIGLGSPIALLRALLPPEAGTPGRLRSVAGRLGGALRVPGLGPLILLLVMALLVFTPWLGWSQQGAGPRAITMLVLLAAGLALALPITDEGAQVSSLAYAAMLGLGLVEFLLDAVPGMVLRLDAHVVQAGHWLAVRPSWGPSPLADQRLAGDWLWFFAEAGDLPFLLILVVAWIRSDAREAARQDAELDRLELERAPGELAAPWWETEGR